MSLQSAGCCETFTCDGRGSVHCLPVTAKPRSSRQPLSTTAAGQRPEGSKLPTVEPAPRASIAPATPQAAANPRALSPVTVGSCAAVQNRTLTMPEAMRGDDPWHAWLAGAVEASHVGARLATRENTLGDLSAFSGIELLSSPADASLGAGDGEARGNINHRRARLSAVGDQCRASVLPAGVTALRARLGVDHQQPLGRRVG